ncbi:MAG: HEAT repeat domain-containing protein [Phycisphaerae bacterium]
MPPEARRSSLAPRRAVIAFAAVVAVGVGAALPFLSVIQTRQFRADLTSADAELRKRGAWALADRVDLQAVPILIGQLASERDADVRESFVYALGRLGRAQAWDAVAAAATGDEYGFVRCAAWLAAARIDPARFRGLAAGARQQDSWDTLGIAHGRAQSGEIEATLDLLRLAETGDEGQRVLAAKALDRTLRTLLVAAGRWPLALDVPLGQPWTLELIAEVRRRCGELDLPALSRDSARHWEAGQHVARNVWRLTHARDRIAAMLTQDSGPPRDADSRP